MLSFSVEQLWTISGLLFFCCVFFVVLNEVIPTQKAMIFYYPPTIPSFLHRSFHNKKSHFFSVIFKFSSLSTKPIKTIYLNKRIGE